MEKPPRFGSDHPYQRASIFGFRWVCRLLSERHRYSWLFRSCRALEQCIDNSSDTVYCFHSIHYAKTPVRVFRSVYGKVGISIITESIATGLRKRFAILVPLRIIVCFSVFCIGVTCHYWRLIKTVETYPLVLFGKMVPAYLGVAFGVGNYTLAINADIITELLYVVLIFGLATGYQTVSWNINAELTQHSLCETVTGILRREFRSLRLLQDLTRDLTDTFGILILVNYIRDMIAVLGLIALFLQVQDNKQGLEESDSAYADQIQVRVQQSYWDCTILITLANAALRIGVCLYCNLNVRTCLQFCYRDFNLCSRTTESGWSPETHLVLQRTITFRYSQLFEICDVKGMTQRRGVRILPARHRYARCVLILRSQIFNRYLTGSRSSLLDQMDFSYCIRARVSCTSSKWVFLHRKFQVINA